METANQDSRRFSSLVKAVVAKKTHAIPQFRSSILPYLRVIARRAFGCRNGLQALGTGGVAEAGWELLGGRPSPAGSGRESSIDCVAQEMCEWLIRALQSEYGSSPQETIFGLLGPPTVFAHSSLDPTDRLCGSR